MFLLQKRVETTILESNNNLKNLDVELQQRSVEYLQLSTVASIDVLVVSFYI